MYQSAESDQSDGFRSIGHVRSRLTSLSVNFGKGFPLRRPEEVTVSPKSAKGKVKIDLHEVFDCFQNKKKSLEALLALVTWHLCATVQ